MALFGGYNLLHSWLKPIHLAAAGKQVVMALGVSLLSVRRSLTGGGQML